MQDMTSNHPYVRRLVKAMLDHNGVEEEWLRRPVKSLPSIVPDLWAELNSLIQLVWSHKMERVVIHGDYDADGITAACSVDAALKSALKTRGLTNVQVAVHLPERRDGYGVSEISLDFFDEFRPDVVLTLDCGTSDARLYRWAEAHPDALVIAVDHHPSLPGFTPPQLPSAERTSLCCLNERVRIGSLDCHGDPGNRISPGRFLVLCRDWHRCRSRADQQPGKHDHCAPWAEQTQLQTTRLGGRAEWGKTIVQPIRVWLCDRSPD